MLNRLCLRWALVYLQKPNLMRKALTILFLLIAPIAYAQNIDITVVGSPDSVVSVSMPFNGRSWWPGKKEYKLDAANSLHIVNDVKQAGPVIISNNEKRETVFVEPGTSLKVTITTKNNRQYLQVTGPNADGILLARRFPHAFYQSKAKAYFKKDSTLAGFIKLINTDKEKELHAFDSLFALKKISPAFYNRTVLNNRYYYATVLANVLCSQYLRSGANYPGHIASFAKDMEDAWAENYKVNPVNDEQATYADAFFDYADSYISPYKIEYLAEKTGSYQPITPENHFDITYKAFETSFTGGTREYMLFMFLYDQLIQKDYQPQLVSLYKRFKATYPKSVYDQYLAPLENDIVVYQQKAAEAFKADQKVLAGNTINSFDELLAGFAGKTVYIDMWATWCGPCKEEFEFIPAVKKFLTANKIEMLYISMDNTAADKQWQEMIRYYNLGGNHVRTSDNLRNDLIKKFWGGKGYAIPRYVIVKNGAIVEKDALRPSDKEKLFAQISKYL